MIHISAQQMAALRAQAPLSFAARLVRYIDANFAGQRAHSGEALPALAELREVVPALVRRAQSFGISSERGVGQFVTLALGYARQFDQHPRVMEMLLDASASPEENMQRVLDTVIVAEARGVR